MLAHLGDNRLQPVGMPFRDVIAGFQQLHYGLHDGAAGALPPMQFFPVHVVVRALENFLHGHGRIRRDRIADRQTDRRQPLRCVGVDNHFMDSLTNRLNRCFVDRVQQYGELVAADPGDDIAAPDAGRQNVRGAGQQDVALFVAHRVIDQFQAVQVDHDQADRSVLALIDALHLFFEIGPVVYSGQGIVKTSVLQQHFRFFALVDFPLGLPI